MSSPSPLHPHLQRPDAYDHGSFDGYVSGIRRSSSGSCTAGLTHEQMTTTQTGWGQLRVLLTVKPAFVVQWVFASTHPEIRVNVENVPLGELMGSANMLVNIDTMLLQVGCLRGVTTVCEAQKRINEAPYGLGRTILPESMLFLDSLRWMAAEMNASPDIMQLQRVERFSPGSVSSFASEPSYVALTVHREASAPTLLYPIQSSTCATQGQAFSGLPADSVADETRK